MKCTECNEEILLIPSARERAKECGGKASDYTGLFTIHDKCAVAKSKKETSDLIEKFYS